MMSPSDALYSFEFLKVLVSLRVPNVSVLNILSQVLAGIVPSIHCCTNNEAENLGIFLMQYFEMIDRWSDKAVYDVECATHSGFRPRVGTRGGSGAS